MTLRIANFALRAPLAASGGSQAVAAPCSVHSRPPGGPVGAPTVIIAFVHPIGEPHV